MPRRILRLRFIMVLKPSSPKLRWKNSLTLARRYGERMHFVTIPQWTNPSIDDWLRRLEAFYNIGSRIVKFHMAPGTLGAETSVGFWTSFARSFAKPWPVTWC